MEIKVQKRYVNVHFQINEEIFEMAYAYLSNYKLAGIEEKLDSIVVCFEYQDWNPQIKAEIIEIMNYLDKNINLTKEEIVVDKNWNEEWEKNLPPIIVSEKLAIVPSWKADEVDSELKILIDPKMSFGTGHHATTRLVCKLMENQIQKDSFWVDAGTGTGVLAILAVKLGAKSAFAFDNNSWSIENAIENVEMNHCSDKIEILQADINLLEIPECDGIAANLYTHLLIPSLGKFYKSLEKSSGNLVVSGILVYDEKEIISAALNAGFKHVVTLYEDEWIALHFKV